MAIDAYKNMLATGADPLTALYVGVGVFAADQVGIVSLSNAVTGEDLATGRQLSAGERWIEGISGAFDLVSAATGGLGAIKSGIRATGQCAKLGKYFTNCCFVEDVPLLYCAPTITVSATENDLKDAEGGDSDAVEEICELDVVETMIAEELAETLSPKKVDDEITAAEPEYAQTINPIAYAINIKESNRSFGIYTLALTALGGAVAAAKLRSRREKAFEGYQDEEALDDEEIVLPLLSSEKEVTPSQNEIIDDSETFAIDITTKEPIGDNDDQRRRVRKAKRANDRRGVFYSALIVCLLSLFAMTWLIAHPKRTVEQRIIARVTTEVVEKNVSKPESDTVISEPVETQIADSPIVAQGDDNADATERSNLIADDNSSVVANDGLVKEITPTSLASSVEIRAKKISEAQIGDRTPGVNPEGNDGSDESVFREQRHCVYSLLVAKENGSLCFVELLRPDDWLITTGAQLRRKTDGRIVDKLDLITDGMLQLESDRDYEPVVWLELPEMGCVGWARVVNQRTFQYTPGVGNLVTGTFRHISDDVIDLTVEGQDKPIGVTNSHPFWSVDREEFVPAGELLQGERLLLFSGDTARVTQKLPRPGPHVVYNIEVFGEHVYQVTLDGVVVHNHCPNLKVKTNHIDELGYERVIFQNRRVYRKEGVDRAFDWTPSNITLMKNGNAPFGKDGKRVSLHHLHQEEPGAMCEVRQSLHSRLLHKQINRGESFRKNKDLNDQYEKFRSDYWIARVEEYLNNGGTSIE